MKLSYKNKLKEKLDKMAKEEKEKKQREKEESERAKKKEENPEEFVEYPNLMKHSQWLIEDEQSEPQNPDEMGFMAK